MSRFPAPFWPVGQIDVTPKHERADDFLCERAAVKNANFPRFFGFLAISLGSTAGCSAPPASRPIAHMISSQQLQNIVPGSTTYPELIAALGSPVEAGNNGYTILAYRLAPAGHVAFVAVDGTHDPRDLVVYYCVSDGKKLDFGTTTANRFANVRVGMEFQQVLDPKQA